MPCAVSWAGREMEAPEQRYRAIMDKRIFFMDIPQLRLHESACVDRFPGEEGRFLKYIIA
jgi:hypothetical protein